jgi:hypothetical protein
MLHARRIYKVKYEEAQFQNIQLTLTTTQPLSFKKQDIDDSNKK